MVASNSGYRAFAGAQEKAMSLPSTEDVEKCYGSRLIDIKNVDWTVYINIEDAGGTRHSL